MEITKAELEYIETTLTPGIKHGLLCQETFNRMIQLLEADRVDEKIAKRPWWTKEEVAQHLKLNVRTVSTYIKRGLLHPRRLGKKLVRFDPEEIESLAGDYFPLPAIKQKDKVR